MKYIYLIKHSGPFVDIKNYENYDNSNEVLWNDFNRNMILSAAGEERAKELSNLEELLNIDRIFASDSARAIETAKYIAEKNNIKIELDNRINERKFGVDYLKDLPSDFNKLSFDDKKFKMNKGESFNEVDQRFKSFIIDLLSQKGNNRNVVVTHGLILLSYLETICKFSFDGQKFNIQYNNKTILDGNPKSPSVYKITFNNNNEVIDVGNI